MYMNTLKFKIISIILIYAFSLMTSTNLNGQWEILGSQNFLTGETFSDGYHFEISNSTPYLVYADRLDNYEVKLIEFDGTEWHEIGSESMPIGEVRYPSMAFSENDIYLAYSDQDAGNKTTVIKYDGNAWTYVGPRGFSEDEGRFQSIAIKNGEPYVAFEDKAYSFESSVMKFNGTNWEFVGSPGCTEGISEGQAVHNEISFNQGELYMIFNSPGQSLAANTYVMKYEEAEGNWLTLGNQGFPNSGVARQSLDFIDGNPYFAYLDFNQFEISAKKYEDDQWLDVGIPGFAPDIGNGPEIHVNNSTPYVAFDDFSVDRKLTVMYFDGINWLPLEGFGVSPNKAVSPEISSIDNTLYVVFLDDPEFSSGNLTVMTYKLTTDVIQTEMLNSSFQISPNPISDQLTITSEDEIKSISILSIEGKLIGNFSNNNINLERLSCGLYLIQVETDKGIGTQKFVKN